MQRDRIFSARYSAETTVDEPRRKGVMGEEKKSPRERKGRKDPRRRERKRQRSLTAMR